MIDWKIKSINALSKRPNQFFIKYEIYILGILKKMHFYFSEL